MVTVHAALGIGMVLVCISMIADCVKEMKEMWEGWKE